MFHTTQQYLVRYLNIVWHDIKSVQFLEKYLRQYVGTTNLSIGTNVSFSMHSIKQFDRMIQFNHSTFFEIGTLGSTKLTIRMNWWVF